MPNDPDLREMDQSRFTPDELAFLQHIDLEGSYMRANNDASWRGIGEDLHRLLQIIRRLAGDKSDPPPPGVTSQGVTEDG